MLYNKPTLQNKQLLVVKNKQLLVVRNNQLIIIGASREGDTTMAGVKRFSNDDTDGGSEVKKPYDGRGYCLAGAYGSWTVVAVR